MKRLIIAIVIVAVLFLCVGYGSFYVDKTTTTMLGQFTKIEQALEKEDYKAAKKLVTQAENEWIKFEETLTYFVNHNEICTIGEGIAAMKPYIDNKEKAEFLSELSRTRVVLLHLAQMEKVG